MKIAVGQTKPRSGAQINWAHPLARDLAGCFLFNEQNGTGAMDLVTGQSAIHSAVAPDFQYGQGPNVGTVSATNKYFLLETGPRIGGYPYTFAVRASKIVSSGTGAAISMSNTNVNGLTPALRFQASTTIRWGLFFEDLDITVSDMTARTVDAVGLLRSNSSQEAYEAGILRGSRTAGHNTYGSANNRITFGTQSWDLNSGMSCVLHHAYIYRRAISPDEAMWLHTEPYAFLFTAPYKKYFPGFPYLQSISASMGPFSGAVHKRTSIKLNATMSAWAGFLTRATAYRKSLTGTMASFSGAMHRRTGKHMAGSMASFSAGVGKRTLLRLTASMASFSAAVHKRTGKKLAGSMASFSAGVGKRTLIRMAASMGSFSAAMHKRTGKHFAARMNSFSVIFNRLRSILTPKRPKSLFNARSEMTCTLTQRKEITAAVTNRISYSARVEG